MSFAEKFSRMGQEKTMLVREFRRLLEPISPDGLESLARRAAGETRRNFGRTMRLFAPLYVSNECINNCSYCGFSRDNDGILRVTLGVGQVVAEARHLAAEGFRNILLVSGEHPRLASNGYLEQCVGAVAGVVPSVGLEVGPMETEDYGRMVRAGAETLVVYQETYDRDVYSEMHTAGPKRNFDWRLETPERAYAAGFRRLQVGALLGLSEDWRREAEGLAAHVDYLLRTCWRAALSVSLPRLRPCAGGIRPACEVGDAEFVQLICALRVTFPQIGITLSTREAPGLRDALIPLGITTMSAGSHTEPGGYTGQGREDLHRTVRGRRVETEPAGAGAEGQFEIADGRSAREVAELLRGQGFEPVWKDWDAGLLPGARGEVAA